MKSTRKEIVPRTIKTHCGCKLLKFTHLGNLAGHTDMRLVHTCENRKKSSPSQKSTPSYKQSRAGVISKLMEKWKESSIWESGRKTATIIQYREGRDNGKWENFLDSHWHYEMCGPSLVTISFCFLWLKLASRDIGLFTGIHCVLTFVTQLKTCSH